MATRQAAQVNGIDQLAITHIDGLDQLSPIRVCTAYQLNGRRIDYMPPDIDDMAELKPVYRNFPGWQTDTSAARTWIELPPKTRKYLRAIAKMIGAKIAIASIGPARSQTIIL